MQDTAQYSNVVCKQMICDRKPGKIFEGPGLNKFELSPTARSDVSVQARMRDLDYPPPLTVVYDFVLNSAAVAYTCDAFSFDNNSADLCPPDERFLLDEETPWCLSICSENSFEVIGNCCRKTSRLLPRRGSFFIGEECSHGDWNCTRISSPRPNNDAKALFNRNRRRDIFVFLEILF
jgi:hypothetical protein